MRSQVQSREKIYWPVLYTHHFTVYSKSLVPTNSPFFPVKKDLTLKYNAPKLPFFCNMEEKSRNKFHVFLKLRAGNDESYMKMIASPNSSLSGK